MTSKVDGWASMQIVPNQGVDLLRAKAFIALMDVDSQQVGLHMLDLYRDPTSVRARETIKNMAF